MEEEEEEKDDGSRLKTHYDLVCCGTGLVESIVACAAARAGKSVLHLDKNNFYGRECTSSPLDSFLSRCRLNYAGSLHCDLEEVGTDGPAMTPPLAASPTGVSTVLEFAELSEQVKLSHRVIDFLDLAEGASLAQQSFPQAHPSCGNYLMERCTASSSSSVAFSSATCHPAFFGYIQHHRMTARRAWLKSRSFNIDWASRLLLGSSVSVDAMIASGVSKYLEFKSVEGIFYIHGPDDKHAVPCTKGDIFTTKLLNALEKRALMKFLQAVVDWGQSCEGKAVATLNERELAQGRALKRPQNKDNGVRSVPSSPASSSCSSFHAYLEAMKVPARLQNIIVHSLCLDGAPHEEGSGLCADDALSFLYQHMSALGKFGDTAFLSILYGSAELPQAFCRMCAVWGGTYVLRRTIQRVTLREAAPGAGVALVDSVQDSCGCVLTCGALVCNSGDWPVKKDNQSASPPSSSTFSFIASRIAIVDAPILPLSRCIGIIAPQTVGIDNAQAVFVVQMDSSAAVAPDGAWILHMETTISIDSSSDLAREALLQGSTTPWAAIMSHPTFVRDAVALMRRVGAFFASGSVPFTELCFATSVRPLFECGKSFITTLPDGRALANVAICGESRQSFHSHDDFHRAKDIFAQLFPGEAFFPPRTSDADTDGGTDGSGGQAQEFDEDESALEAALAQLGAPSNIETVILKNDEI